MKRLLCFALTLALLASVAYAESEETTQAEETPRAIETPAVVEWSLPETDDWSEPEEEDSGETIIMSIGARNQGVTLLQQALIAQGYLSGEADGSFGNGTQEAVRAFQTAQGLEADGYVRLSTIKALEPDAAKRTIDLGDSGLLVYGIQKLLSLYGYYGASPDCAFGSGTKNAMRLYMERVADEMAQFVMDRAEAERAHYESLSQEDQSSAIIIDVPIVTADTLSLSGAVDEDWLDFLIQSSVPKSETLRLDDRGQDVSRMQRRLKALGYMASSADGVFGQNTQLALKYFQRRNSLDENGVCDAHTQKRLFSDAAKASDMYVSPYKAKVSTTKNRVYIYKWTGNDYGDMVKTFVCTTGAAKTPTIKGTFQAPGQNGVWYKMDGCWVMYAFVIDGGYFFHSVLFNKEGATKPTSSSVANLGRNASHGCVRLSVEDAQWIYENCAPGMTVVIE